MLGNKKGNVLLAIKGNHEIHFPDEESGSWDFVVNAVELHRVLHMYSTTFTFSICIQMSLLNNEASFPCSFYANAEL